MIYDACMHTCIYDSHPEIETLIIFFSSLLIHTYCPPKWCRIMLNLSFQMKQDLHILIKLIDFGEEID